MRPDGKSTEIIQRLLSTWQVVICLWLLSVIGSVFSFFTLAYIGMLASLVYLVKSICDVSHWDHPFSLMYSKIRTSFLGVSVSLEPFGFPYSAFSLVWFFVGCVGGHLCPTLCNVILLKPSLLYLHGFHLTHWIFANSWLGAFEPICMSQVLIEIFICYVLWTGESFWQLIFLNSTCISFMSQHELGIYMTIC